MTEPGQAGSNDGVDAGGTDNNITALVEKICSADFEQWYLEKRFAQNIREGKPYFNGPRAIHDPEYHSPSKLNQCHRKTYYRHRNAPEELEEPEGIYWFGTRFEEDLAIEFLSDIVEADEYVRNSIWVDFTVETDAGELRFRGATDPVIVGRDSQPFVLSEVKTTQITNLEQPKLNHVAQAHAYMRGLSRKYDQKVTDAVLLYTHRKTFASKCFHVRFDNQFWHQTVLEWAETQTVYRDDGSLPPADPELKGECNYCDFKHRCGRGKNEFDDVAADGFLPLFDQYPREKVVEYLEVHDNRGAKLTPTLAHQYEDLAETYDVLDWYCQICGATYEWDSVEWNESTDNPPLCQTCSAEVGSPVPLGCPPPAEQHENGEEGEHE